MHRLLDTGQTILESDEYFGGAIWHSCKNNAGKTVGPLFKPVRRQIEMIRSEPELARSKEFGFLYYKDSHKVIEEFKKVYKEQCGKQ